MTQFRIGIDLGTTNCALASIPANSSLGATTVLSLVQQETDYSTVTQLTLPSFLFLPPQATPGGWIAGRLARQRTAELPGRVIHSAKSWFVHHATDRRAKFLPQGSTDIPPADQLSPIEAQARLLDTLATAWNAVHPGARLAEQDLAITVPASFDPVAQQLTLEAARLAGFPESTILLEEPQAAFYAWMENDSEAFEKLAAGGRKSHVLVVDIGGGTTDLSLFSIEPRPDSPAPRLQRIAVSDHLLLGGDNLDLALAHCLEKKIAQGSQLSPTTFSQLVAIARDIKEDALGSSHDPHKVWPVAVAKPGASLLAGTLRTEISTTEIATLLIEGFFPLVTAGERPLRAASGLREMGLPYAKDPAVSRHISDFLRDRPPVDFILFNGGLTKSRAIRSRIIENLTRWQPDRPPTTLQNDDPDLAVARGASRFLHLRATGDTSRIEAGSSHAYYINAGNKSALCLLPQDAAPETPFTAAQSGLRALIAQPASFELLRNPRRPNDIPGTLVPIDNDGFLPLPPLETILAPPVGKRPPPNPNVRVELRATLRSTGLLRVELLCAEPGLNWNDPWPLEFSLRGNQPASKGKAADLSDAVSQAGAQLSLLLSPERKSKQKLTANTVFSTGEKLLSAPKSAWSGGIVRRLFDLWLVTAPNRLLSADHEETWLHLAGWLLRPGCGMIGDPERVTSLATILTAAPTFSSGAVKIQRWICARRIAAGLDTAQATSLWDVASKDWSEGTHPSAEIALLAGSLESLPADVRFWIARRLATSITQKPQNPAYWKGLGRLLSRLLIHAGPEQVLTPDLVEEILDQLGDIEPGESIRPEAAAAWLRAARLTGLRAIDVPQSSRNQIDALLRKWDITDVRRRVLHESVPIASADRTGLLGESPPPGLSLGTDL